MSTAASLRTAPDMLRTFVERVERVQEEINGLNGDKRDLYAEAKNAGFDVKALKIVIGRRAKDADALTELDAIVETYEAALGMPVATRAPAREPERPVKPRPAPRAPEIDLTLPAILDRRQPQASEKSPDRSTQTGAAGGAT